MAIEIIDNWRTDEIVCPYCGYEFTDSWEYNDLGVSKLFITCRDCKKYFDTTIHFEVSYSTDKID